MALHQFEFNATAECLKGVKKGISTSDSQVGLGYHSENEKKLELCYVGIIMS